MVNRNGSRDDFIDIKHSIKRTLAKRKEKKTAL